MERHIDTEFIDAQTRRDYYTTDDGSLIEKTTFDPNPTLEDAKFFRDQDVNRKAPGRLVALLPMWLIDKWRTEYGVDWFTATQEQRRALLNDPDYAAFRTGGGRV